MGKRLNFALLLIVMIAAAAAVIIFIDITLFCQEQTELDFKIFKVPCSTVPNKGVELDAAFNRSCYIFRTRYSCQTEMMDSVSVPFAEFGKEQRDYKLIELCQLKNPFYISRQCATACGCKV